LQLKVEQSISLENENKRLNEKLKSEKDTQKMIEEEITEQSKRRKSAEEDLKKIKEKYDELQTRSILAPKKNKNM
jgi:DNA repair exonuclease SbcCD ATPase subunit